MALKVTSGVGKGTQRKVPPHRKRKPPMNLWQNYLKPQNLTEAVTALHAAPGPAIPIAGGTDLMLDLQQGRHAMVHTLVDLTGVEEMNRLEIRGEELVIGA